MLWKTMQINQHFCINQCQVIISTCTKLSALSKTVSKYNLTVDHLYNMISNSDVIINIFLAVRKRSRWRFHIYEGNSIHKPIPTGLWSRDSTIKMFATISQKWDFFHHSRPISCFSSHFLDRYENSPEIVYKKILFGLT